LTDSTHAEVELRLGSLNTGGELKPGTPIEFEGVAVGLLQDPFDVVFEVEQAAAPVFGPMASFWYFGQDHGRVRDGRYRDLRMGVEFQLPAEWSVPLTRPAVGGSDLALLTNTNWKDAKAGVWMQRAKTRISCRASSIYVRT
jgi:hypothetical protein